MRSLLSIFQHKYLFLTSFAWGWFEVVALPKPMLIVFLMGAMIVDLLTGLIKSWGKGEATSSAGLRKTVKKIGVYTGAILGVWVLANLLAFIYNQNAIDYAVFVNTCIGFLTFIELYSVFENLYEIDPESIFSRKFIGPILKFLKGRLDKNPIDNLKIDDDGKPN